MIYAGTLFFGAAAVAGAGTLAVTAIQGRASAAARPVAQKAGFANRAPDRRPVAQSPSSPAPQVAERAVATVSQPAPAAAPPLVPILANGETTLGAGITATRSDSTVTVLFDTDGLRTRRRDKFERLVRATLPAVYGRRADSVLAGVPDGTIAAQGDLLTELPSRGVRLVLTDGWKLTLYPETRPGRDGPLVIRYRVAVVP